MKTVGIIAEYNPFHRGHAYQIEQVRKQTGADYVVVVMSGNFVQRGTPAWTDKYLRTQMALAGGASLVIELPVCYATASAEEFAFGAVSLLHQLDFVDTLCFGSECGNLEPLQTIAAFLISPDEDFETQLREQFQTGMSYPAARDNVLTQKFPSLLQEYPTLLSEPNNILGIEYCKALLHLDSNMQPFTIARTDGGYHETRERQGFLSASGIRRQWEEACFLSDRENAASAAGKPLWTQYKEDCLLSLGECIPPYVQKLLRDNPEHFPVTAEDLTAMLYYRLRTTTDKEVLSVLDMTPELFHRMQHLLPQCTSLSDYITAVKTKQYTYTRISRALLHLLLHIRASYTDSPALYGRLLGFRGDASRLLRKTTKIPVITKAADAENILTAFYNENEILLQNSHAEPGCKNDSLLLDINKASLASVHWQTDLLADDIYRQLLYQKFRYLLPDTYHAPVITI